MEIDDLSTESSDRLKSGGGGVFRRLSSVNAGEGKSSSDGDGSGWVLGGLERAAESWSLSMDASTSASWAVSETGLRERGQTHLVTHPLTVGTPPLG